MSDIRLRPTWRSQLGLFVVFWILLPIVVAATIASPTAEGGAAIGIVMWLAMIAIAITLWYRRYSSLYYVDGDRIEHRTGIIARDVRSIRLRDLRNVNMRQGIVDRMLGIGTLEFSSAGGSGIEVAWPGISAPASVRQQIEAMRDQ